MRMDLPYDPDAYFGNKRSIAWTGYKAHVTEICDEATLHVMTHVETTEAGVTPPTLQHNDLKSGSFEATVNDARFSSDATQRVAPFMPQMGKIHTAHVPPFHPFELLP
jgi:hypothetical protein